MSNGRSCSRKVTCLRRACGVPLVLLAVKGSKDETCCGNVHMRGPKFSIGTVRAANTKSAFYKDSLGCLISRSFRGLARRRLKRVLAFTGTTTTLMAAGGNTVGTVPIGRRILRLVRGWLAEGRSVVVVWREGGNISGLNKRHPFVM